MILLPILFACAAAKQVGLLDTRAATSELKWRTYSGRSSEEGWLEETVTNIDAGSNNRAYVVCDVARDNVDNWLMTPYIPRGQANRISIEVTFTMRDCDLFPRQPKTCGETFTLLYHETSHELFPEKGDSMPPWKETALATDGFKIIDRITGDTGRFSDGAEGSSPENVETRDIPVSKGGVYFAIRDQGACTSILSVKIFSEVCEDTVANLAWFPETFTAAQPADLREAKGRCVDNAVVGDREPMYICKGDGTWDRLSGACQCRPGYAPLGDTCKPCEEGEYSEGAGECRSCPKNSVSRSRGAAECACLIGYFRASTDQPSDACTQPPSRPLGAKASDVTPNSATITWEEPLSKGGRRDLWYRVECKECPPGWQRSPGSRTLNTTKVVIHGLAPRSLVTIFIYAENEVSHFVPGIPMYAVVEVTTTTSNAETLKIKSLRVQSSSAEGVSLAWAPPLADNSEARVQEYQVEYAEVLKPSDTPRKLNTNLPEVSLVGLRPDTEYRIRVRALVDREWSEWSYFVYATTSSADAPGAAAEKGGGSESAGTIVLIIVGCVIVLCLIVLGIIYATRHRTAPDRRKQPSDLDVLDYRAGGNLTPDYPHNHHFGPASSHEHTLGKKMTAPLMSGTLRGPIYKPYIDPFDYEDPNMALREFTHEIDPQYLYIEQIILGGGEFGEVHQGKLRLPGRPEEKVAIKSLLPNATQKNRQDFLQEAAVMGQFEHPNVIRLKGVISRSDPVMIITEFMLNKSLDHFLRQNDGALSLGQQLAMLRGISAGMKYLSDKGYVHRDLAARNVLVDAALECRISDFGLSRGMGTGMGSAEQVYHTKGGKIPVRWTAPEAISHRKYTSASDVWSMGIVIWEVASYGERPYWDWSNQEVIKSVESGYRLPPPLNCPPGLHALMLDCWRRERNERPPFAALLRRLDEFARIPELAYAPSSNSTLSSDLYDHTLPPSQYHHTTTSTLSTPLGTPSPNNPPPPAPLHPPPLPSLQELLSSLGLAHFARPMSGNGVDSVLALARLGIVDLMTYGLGQADCQRIADAVSRLTASTLPRRPLPQPPSHAHSHPPLPSIATLSRGSADQGYFI